MSSKVLSYNAFSDYMFITSSQGRINSVKQTEKYILAIHIVTTLMIKHITERNALLLRLLDNLTEEYKTILQFTNDFSLDTLNNFRTSLKAIENDESVKDKRDEIKFCIDRLNDIVKNKENGK